MSDKQRQAHNLARYWEGPLTRAEAQKVFDETAQVIQQSQQTIMKIDMVLALLVEKSGCSTEEIQLWMNERVKKIAAEQAAKQAQAPQAQPPQEATEAQPALVTLD